MQILTIRAIKGIIKEPRSRGISGALYLQFSVELPGISGVDVWVFRNRNS